jgi:hypothetical protein
LQFNVRQAITLGADNLSGAANQKCQARDMLPVHFAVNIFGNGTAALRSRLCESGREVEGDHCEDRRQSAGNTEETSYGMSHFCGFSPVKASARLECSLPLKDARGNFARGKSISSKKTIAVSFRFNNCGVGYSA